MSVIRAAAAVAGAAALTVADKALLAAVVVAILGFVFALLGSHTRSTHLVAIIAALRADRAGAPPDDGAPGPTEPTGEG
jgi:hypothetical protein